MLRNLFITLLYQRISSPKVDITVASIEAVIKETCAAIIKETLLPWRALV